MFKSRFVTTTYIKFGKPSKIDNRQGVYGGNTPHAERETIEIKDRYLRNPMAAGGRLEQEQRTEEEILGTKNLPNGRLWNRFLKFFKKLTIIRALKLHKRNMVICVALYICLLIMAFKVLKRS